jgi:hypothetical protein
LGSAEPGDPLTLFEYLAIAYSLVISFAVVRAASVLPHVIVPGRQYWVHTVWVLANLATSLLIFWNFWSYREVAWTLGRFSLILALPTSVFILASILAPDEPAEVQSWREYYYSVRVKFFVSGIFFFAIVLVGSTVILDMPIFHPFRLYQTAFFGTCLAGAISDRPRVHASLASLAIVGFAFFALRLFAEPGSLSFVQ